MLQTIRDKSQGVIALLIIGFVCITFALWGIHNYFGAVKTKPIAKVNGQKITAQQFQISYDRFRQAQIHSHPELFASQQAIQNSKKELLDSLVTNLLLAQSAKRNNFIVNRNLLELELASMPVFQDNGYFSKARFQQFLNNARVSESEFFQVLKENMLTAQVKSGFTLTDFALPDEVKQAVTLINEQRSFNYVIIPADSFLHTFKVSEQKAKTFYQNHQNQFIIPQKVSINYLMISLPEIMKQLQPTKKALRQYYQNNINHFTVPKKWQLAHIFIAVPPNATEKEWGNTQHNLDNMMKSLKAGATFSGMATEYSDDVNTAKKGGIMPVTTLAQLDQEWQSHVARLSTGEITAPFKVNNGFEIIKVITTSPAVTKSYMEVKNKVRADYIKEKAQKLFENKVDKLGSLTFEHPDSLEPAAKALHLTVKTTPSFSQYQKNLTGILKNPKVVGAAFSKDVMIEKNNSDIIPVSNDAVLVLRLNKETPPSTKAFSQIQSGIVKTLQNKMAAKKAKKQAASIVSRLIQDPNISLGKLAAQHHFHMETISSASRHNNGKLNPNLVVAAFAINPTQNGTRTIKAILLNEKDTAIIQLTNVKPGDLTSAQPNIQKFYRQGIEESNGMLAYALYVEGLRQKAKIQYFNNTLGG